VKEPWALLLGLNGTHVLHRYKIHFGESLEY